MSRRTPCSGSVVRALDQQRQSYRCPTDFCYFFLPITFIFRPRKNNYLFWAWSSERPASSETTIPQLRPTHKVGKTHFGYRLLFLCVCPHCTGHRHSLAPIITPTGTRRDEYVWHCTLWLATAAGWAVMSILWPFIYTRTNIEAPQHYSMVKLH